MKERLTIFLQKNVDVFAWSAADMPGIDPKVMVHQLNIDMTYRLVKQKKQSFAPEHQKAIIKETDKLIKTRFIKEVVMYPDWLANMMIMKKTNEKWCMYIDFTDLNKAYPKDHALRAQESRCDLSVPSE